MYRARCPMADAQDKGSDGVEAPRPVRLEMGRCAERAPASPTWTRMDGCPRPPITIKTAGMRLYEMAGRYDRGAFESGGDEL